MISTEHVLRAQQFDKKLIAQVFDAVEEMETVVARGGSEELRGRIMASLFYSVSTRTRLSFESAMHRLGGSVICTENPQSLSDFASSGHFEDTISMVNQYSDLIVLRHPIPVSDTGPPRFRLSRLAFRIDPAILRLIRQRAIIMHPFPRVDSIAPEVDSDPRAHYFQQISNGLFIRMALLQMLLTPQRG